MSSQIRTYLHDHLSVFKLSVLRIKEPHDQFHGIRAGGLQVATRKEANDRLVRAGEDTVKESKKLLNVVIELGVWLSNEVYTADMKTVIEELLCSRFHLKN